jgi:hypothetical protein
VAALREAPAQADAGGGVVRGGHPPPVDGQRLRQAARDVDDERRVRAYADRRDADHGVGAGCGDPQDGGGEQGGAHPAAG